MTINLEKSNIFFVSIIIIASFFFSFSYDIDAAILAEGAIQSGTIDYPDEFNLYRAITLNSWSLPIQLVAILTKLNFSTFFISKILHFFSTTMYLFGIYLICKSITDSRVLSFLISFLIILLRKNFGDLDYPTLIFHEASNGLIAQAMFTMIFGFFINNNYKLGIFFSIISITIHFTVGLWINSIIFLCYFINNKYYKNFIFKKENLYIFFLSFLTLFISFFIYYLQKVPFEITKNLYDYKTYMEVWEAHRTGYGAYRGLFNIGYIIKTLILIISMFLFIKLKLNNHKTRFGITALLMHCLLSLSIYILYKHFYILFPEIIIRTIPTRFFTLHSIIGWPIIFSILYIFSKKISKSYFDSKYIFNFFLLILILHSIQQYSKFIERYKGINLNISLYNSQKKLNEFWLKIKNNKIKGYVLVGGSEPCVKTLAIAKKPLFFCAGGLDLLPYFPDASGYVKEITENVYGVSFNNPEIKHLGGIMDIELKKAFEKKSSEDWLILKKDYFITQLIVPKDWKINLTVFATSEKYNYYLIE